MRVKRYQFCMKQTQARTHARIGDRLPIFKSFHAVEIFVALYYGNILRIFPGNPLSEQRDPCIISKGHGSICLYPILADLGFFEMDALETVCKPGSFLGGIPDPVIPGYETVNGSLGHGPGVAGAAAADAGPGRPTGRTAARRTRAVHRAIWLTVCRADSTGMVHVYD